MGWEAAKSRTHPRYSSVSQADSRTSVSVRALSTETCILPSLSAGSGTPEI